MNSDIKISFHRQNSLLLDIAPPMTSHSNATADLQELDDDGDSMSDSPSARGRSAAVMVKPVSNAIRILRYLSQTGAPERAADIARHLSINSSTCFNILRTLVAEDVIEFEPNSKMYSAGQGLARLVDQLATQGQRIEHAKPYMAELASRFHVTVTLWRRMGTDRIVLVASETSPTDLRIDMPTGQRLPLLMGATGRLFAGQLGLSEDEARREFAGMRWSRPLSFDAYWREVNRAKRRGWALDDGYFANGIASIAAPVRGRDDEIAFTVSAVMIRGHHDEARLDELGAALRDVGVQLAATLF
jgi:DNA-binding IclR family transcriptional regulator